jgi:ABC-type phosphate transport system permease subunit
MSLSNILREPRREITESVMGAGVVAVLLVPFFYGAYYLGHWFVVATDAPDNARGVFGCMLFGTLGMAILVAAGGIFLGVTHAAGEAICDALERRGIHLRPRQRP